MIVCACYATEMTQVVCLQEDELRKEGGKHAHLNAELHVLVEAFAPPSEAHQRISHALMELKKFLVPVSVKSRLVFIYFHLIIHGHVIDST